MSFQSLLNTTMTIQRFTRTQTDNMTPKRTFSAVASITDVPARIEVLTFNEVIIQQRDGVRATHRVFHAPEHIIKEKDRLVIDNVNYDIQSAQLLQDATENHHGELIVLRRR